MLQIGFLLVCSWALLWFFERSPLTVLGFMPTKKTWWVLLFLFFTAILTSTSTFLFRMHYLGERFQLNEQLSCTNLLLESWFQVRTVLTEELLCRGVLLYLLVKRMGETKAVVLTSMLFALLHWFNAGTPGHLLQMSLVFLFTFFMGLVLGFAFVKTRSLLAPFFIHFGWNYMQNFVFPESNTGLHLLAISTPAAEVTVSYLTFFILFFLPKITLIGLTFLVIKRYSQKQAATTLL
jgi:hypothetical protein